jgi:hypothetical protein
LVSGHPADAPLSTADRTTAGVNPRYTAWFVLDAVDSIDLSAF